MRIGFIGSAALGEKDRAVFAQLGQQLEVLTQPEQLAALHLRQQQASTGPSRRGPSSRDADQSRGRSR